MSYLTETFSIPFDPVADPAAVVIFQNTRLMVKLRKHQIFAGKQGRRSRILALSPFL